jgi:hypothetical protein
MDDGVAISYKVLKSGTAVRSADGEVVGTVLRVLENDIEHIFDGIVIGTQHGERFVDAPEVARIAERAVTLTITAAEAEDLPQPERGAPEYRVNPGAGRLARMFGGGWRRRR